VVDAWTAAQEADNVYDSVDGLTAAVVDGQVRFRSGPALLQLDLLPAGTRPAARTLPVIGHGEFRRLLRQLAPEPPAGAPSLPTTPDSSTGWSRPLHADHAVLAAVEAATVQAARARRRPGRQPV
jgi:hypothetical protein